MKKQEKIVDACNYKNMKDLDNLILYGYWGEEYESDWRLFNEARFNFIGLCRYSGALRCFNKSIKIDTNQPQEVVLKKIYKRIIRAKRDINYNYEEVAIPQRYQFMSCKLWDKKENASYAKGLWDKQNDKFIPIAECRELLNSFKAVA